jgi:hypothetical protein
MAPKLAAVFITVVRLFLSLSTCSAAEISIVGGGVPKFPIEGHAFQPSECTIQLSGPIVVGDAQRLKALGSQREGKLILTGTLCLDSPGGSYKEGIAISELLLDQSMTTIVMPGAVCYSTCALIFMTGGDWQDGRAWYRYLQPGAELGFHAPYITRLPNQLYTKDEMEEVFRFAIKSIRDLTRLGREHHVPDTFLPTPILAELLDKGPSELFLIDTVYKAAQLKIDVNGARSPKVTPAALYSACSNLLVRADQGGALDLPPRVSDRVEYTKTGHEIWFAGFGPEALESCVIRNPGEYGTPYDIASRLISTGTKLPEDEVLLRGKVWWLYPPNTPIASLK